MSEILIAARGCVYSSNQTSGGQGFYSLKPGITGTAKAPIFIDGVDGLDGDIIAPVTTIDGGKILHVFGEDFGNVSITGTMLLGSADQNGNAFKTVVSYFNKHRVSAKTTPITVSYPGNVSQKVYLTHLVISRPDPEFHVQPFQFRGVVAEPLEA